MPFDSATADRGSPPCTIQNRRFRPDITGLRAVAVIMVTGYHLRLYGFQGGWAGVDVFFAISGYLIIGQIVNQTDQGAFRYTLFLAKRIRRLLPMATLVLIVSLLASVVLISDTEELKQVALSKAWAGIFVRNLAMAYDWYPTPQLDSPSGHYWSMSTEEQFYLLFPAALAITVPVLRRIKTKAPPASPFGTSVKGPVLVMLSVSAVASLTWATLYDGGLKVDYFSLLGRWWEIAVGGIVAICITDRVASRLSPRTANLLVMPSLLIIVATCAALPHLGFAAPKDRYDFPGFMIFTVAATLVVLAFGGRSESGLAATVLGGRSMQYVGDRSYSLYLWNFAIVTLAGAIAVGGRLPAGADTSTAPGWDTLWMLGLTVLLAVASYSWVERPARFASWWSAHTAKTIIVGVLLIVVTLALSALVYLSA